MDGFFAGINSEKGYIPRLEDCFKDTKLLYILNGTPGCGKSTLMKKVQAFWRDSGYATQRVYCSSDVNSLDGVICPELSVGVCDGTAPHPVLPKVPLLTHRVLDLSAGCGRISDSHSLAEAFARKSEEYKKGYCLITSAVQLRRCGDAMCRHEDEAKERASELFYKKLKSKLPEGQTQTALLHAFTGGGIKTLAPKGTKKTLLLKDNHYSEIYLKELASLASLCRKQAVVTPHPYDSEKLSALYFPHTGMYITLFGEGETRVNVCKASSDKSAKEYYSLSKTVLEKARECFAKAALHHRELEALYAPVIDFTAADRAFDLITE